MWAAGSEFALNDVGCSYTGTTVGSRLVAKDRKTAEYIATQFIDIYNEFLINQ